MPENGTRNVDGDADDAPNDSTNQRADADVDPLEFVRAILHVSPEDAAKVREQAGKKGTHSDRDGPQEGPTGDYGDE